MHFIKDLKQILQRIYNYNVTILNYITDIKLLQKIYTYPYQYCTLIFHKFVVICPPDSVISELTL
jgi:hypothetical protein